MYAHPEISKGYRISRRALGHLRAALGLVKRRRGGQPGNRNRLTHGLYARTFVARREKTRAVLRNTRALLAALTNTLLSVRRNSRFKRETFKIFDKTPWPSPSNLAFGSHLGQR